MHDKLGLAMVVVQALAGTMALIAAVWHATQLTMSDKRQHSLSASLVCIASFLLGGGLLWFKALCWAFRSSGHPWLLYSSRPLTLAIELVLIPGLVITAIRFSRKPTS